jgi:hypothetical protein
MFFLHGIGVRLRRDVSAESGQLTDLRFAVLP